MVGGRTGRDEQTGGSSTHVIQGETEVHVALWGGNCLWVENGVVWIAAWYGVGYCGNRSEWGPRWIARLAVLVVDHAIAGVGVEGNASDET